MKTIIFRADGDNTTGLGHLYRSSALAQYLVKYHCILATRCTIPSVLDELKVQFKEIINLSCLQFYEEAIFFSKKIPKETLFILDGYGFNSEYQAELSRYQFAYYCIDDIHSFRYYAYAIFNHAGGITPQDYKALPFTKFYLGLNYALLRKPFLEAAQERNVSLNNKSCLICFGGADPENITLEIIRTNDFIGRDVFDHLHIVIGGAYRHKDQLTSFIKDKVGITLYQSIEPLAMVELMRSCSYAICSPSTIAYEYMCVGGVVFLKQTADNQADLLKDLIGRGLAFNFSDLSNLNEDMIQDSLLKQAHYFDGRSNERFAKIFDQHFKSINLLIRKAELRDVGICFEWANDPQVREQSFNQSEITLREHKEWFLQKLEDPHCFFYILEIQDDPVAQIRFQIKGEIAIISFLSSNKVRNKGFGSSILAKGLEMFIRDYKNPICIVGYVKKTNIASQRTFERFAFTKELSEDYLDAFKYTMFYGN